jgi:large subunit ribosomal protein L18e
MSVENINPQFTETLRLLRKKSREEDANIWKAVAGKLGTSKHKRVSINLNHMNRYSVEGDTIIVPGKVLGAGDLDHKLSIAAFNFTKQAKEKIEKAGGECLTIQALVDRNPKGSNIKIIG